MTVVAFQEHVANKSNILLILAILEWITNIFFVCVTHSSIVFCICKPYSVKTQTNWLIKKVNSESLHWLQRQQISAQKHFRGKI